MHYKYRYKYLFDGTLNVDFKSESGNIVIYAAGFQGLLVAHLLKKQGISVLCFCDMDKRKHGTQYYGLPVVSPEEAKHKYPEALVVVTPYSIAPAYAYVKDVLKFSKVVTPHSLFFDFDSEEFDVLQELPDWYHPSALDYHIDQFMKNCVNLVTDKTVYASDISVTEVCNLKCKHCTSLMPCYENPRHYTLEEMKKYTDLILKDRVFYNINLEGGEVFTWKPLAEYLEYLCSFPNLLNVYILTNGSILPNENLLRILANPKILIRISDYGDYSKIKEISALFETHNVRYKVFMQKWYELSVFSKEEHSPDLLKKVVDSCCKAQPQGNGTLYLSAGKLYHCPIQANLHNLGLFVSPEGDFVDFSIENNDDIQKLINDMFYKVKLPDLCKHCDGRGFTGVEVEPAVQLEKGETITVKFE